MAVKVTSNYKARALMAWKDIPERERPELDFGVDPDDDSPQYFEAYGRWHKLEDFTVITRGDDPQRPFGHRVDRESPLAAWDAIATDSAFTGIVIRYPTEGYEHDPYGYLVVGWAQELS